MRKEEEEKVLGEHLTYKSTRAASGLIVEKCDSFRRGQKESLKKTARKIKEYRIWTKRTRAIIGV